jgi:hypothetical protein
MTLRMQCDSIHATNADCDRSLETNTFVLPGTAYYPTKIPIE